MGEVAEMMMDGTLCQTCGVFVGEPDGYPRECNHCERESAKDRKAARQKAHEANQLAIRKVVCPVCGKRVKSRGLKDHTRDAHTNISTGASAPKDQSNE